VRIGLPAHRDLMAALSTCFLVKPRAAVGDGHQLATIA